MQVPVPRCRYLKGGIYFELLYLPYLISYPTTHQGRKGPGRGQPNTYQPNALLRMVEQMCPYGEYGVDAASTLLQM